MKKLWHKLILFSALYLGLSFGLDLILPYYWGNPWYSSKIQELEESRSQLPEAFFFGSSRIYRQLKPEVFDSTFSALSTQELSSYNLGAPSTFTPQTYYLYRNFLESDLSENTRYVFLELMEIDTLSEQTLHQERTNYWMNFRDLSLVLQSLWQDPQLSTNSRWKSFRRYSASWLEQLFRLGHFKEQLLNDNYYSREFTGTAGYYPLEAELAQTQHPAIRENFELRREILAQNPEQLKKPAALQETRPQHMDNWLNQPHLERLRKIISDSEKRGIHVIFLLTPRHATPQLLRLSQEIPEPNIINLSDPGEYPGFYDPELSFDIGHLNRKGSRIFSIEVAREFSKIIGQ